MRHLLKIVLSVLSAVLIFLLSGTCKATPCVEAQNESLRHRIARFSMLTKEPHARLCSAGQFCPTLQGTFPSPRQQAVRLTVQQHNHRKGRRERIHLVRT